MIRPQTPVNPSDPAGSCFVDSFLSPFGRIWAVSDSNAVLRVVMPGPSARDKLHGEILRRYGPVQLARGGPIIGRFFRELDQYFSGRLQSFHTPSRAPGTRFQQTVWREVSRIPCGSTRSYGWVASRIGMPGAARAVGQANRRNPTPLLVPCHRVVASGGEMGGYSSGIEQKRRLLELESRCTNPHSGPRPRAIRNRP